eukprot:Skav208349  [mRNA]  locus=scaffold4040:178867:179088:+ [translate_table: standard]
MEISNQQAVTAGIVGTAVTAGHRGERQDAKHGFRFGSGLYFAEDLSKSLSYAAGPQDALRRLVGPPIAPGYLG